jgi:hypothetical protein
MQTKTKSAASSSRAGRLLVKIGVPIAIICGAFVVTYAAVPKTWNAHQALSADDLNGNFDSLDKRVAALEANRTADATTVTALQKQLDYLRSGGVPSTVKLTAQSYNGSSLGGLQGARQLCQSLMNGSNTAHMCSGLEIQRYVAANGSADVMGSGWVLTGMSVFPASDNWIENDCDNFTKNSGNYGVVQNPNGVLAYSSCANLNPVYCCDY